MGEEEFVAGVMFHGSKYRACRGREAKVNGLFALFGTQTQGGPITWNREFSLSCWEHEIPITTSGAN